MLKALLEFAIAKWLLGILGVLLFLGIVYVLVKSVAGGRDVAG